MSRASRVAMVLLLLGAAGCGSPPSPSPTTVDPPDATHQPSPSWAVVPEVPPWHTIECGRLDGHACELVSRAVAEAAQRMAFDFDRPYRLVVDEGCPPDDECDLGLPALAVAVPPAWQGLDTIADTTFAVGETVERWPGDRLPPHLVELVKQSPADPWALWRPDLMVAEPSLVAPGETFEVSYAPPRNRGIGYALERWTDNTWSFEYDVAIRPNGEPSWQEAGVPDGWLVDLLG